jgi:hypothetical protein
MKEIISKLEQMGVTATNKQIDKWLSENKLGLGTLTDGNIVTMARDLKAIGALAVAKAAVEQQDSAVSAAAEPAGENIYTCNDFDYDAEIAALEAIGRRDAEKDADLLFGAHERGYQAAFDRRLQSNASFRLRLVERAAATVRGA